MDYDDEAPGFRFYPTEEELISFYLHQKLEGRMQEDLDQLIPVLYIYDFNPWDLPQLAGERCRRDPQLEEWFFYIPRQEREARGGRPNRLTATGYWKAAGSPGWVYSSDESHRIIGLKRTMVFYRGRAQTRRSGPGSRTEWKMNEYLVIDPAGQPASFSPATAITQGEYSVCRVYKKSKCLRSFDRRPAAPPTARSRQRASYDHQAVDHRRQKKAPSDHQGNGPRSMVEMAPRSSGEGSSPASGDPAVYTNVDHLFLGGNYEDNNMHTMEIYEAPLWDWDSLNWSF